MKPFIYSDGDILELRQYLGSSTEYTVLAGYTETLSGSDNIKTIIERAPTEGKPNWQKMTCSFTMPGGETQDATYQLVLKEGDEEILSNKILLSSYSANISAGTFNHRSGHPSENGFCPNDETYHSEITFTPTTDARITTYAIICNGHYMPRVVLTPEDYGHLGEPYTYADLYNSSAVNSGEAAGTIPQKDIFYTVVAIDNNGNTYGSADLPFTFTGAPQELVYYNDPTFGATDRTRTSHHESAWQGEFDIRLLEGIGANADDVNPSKITGAKIYGIFYPTKQDYQAKTNGVEKELCTVDPTDIGLSYTYRTEVYIKGNPKYAAEWADLEELYKIYDYQSEQVKPTWAAICEKMWFDNMPTDIYIEVTFDGTSLTPSPTPDLAPAKAVSRALGNGGSYTKYTNWAQLPPPNFSNPIITGIETIGADNAAAPVEYYDMHGRRVSAPAPGQLLIRRQGASVTKVF